MSHVNDLKHAKLLAAVVLGTPPEGIKDLETQWLKEQIVGSTTGKEDLDDLWQLFWDEVTVPGPVAAGNFNDRANIWLDGLGFKGPPGAINDKWLAYWEAP